MHNNVEDWKKTLRCGEKMEQKEIQESMQNDA